MALYEKKLHIRKNGVVTDINLWTESGEAGTPALHIRDGGNLVHAWLGEVTDGLASDLRVRKDGVVYAVLKNRWVTINIVQSANQTITVYVDGVPHTGSFAVPYGTYFTAGVVAAAGFSPGALSMASGTTNGDVTISATPASASLTSGSISGTGTLNFTVPGGASVIRIVQGATEHFVGIKSSSVSITYLDHSWWESPSGEADDPDAQWFVACRVTVSSGGTWTYSEPEFVPPGASTDFTVYWGPEINAHGPTDGSVA